MPQNTRSRCQESRPTPPLYRQQTRRRQALSTSRREGNQHQGNNGVARAPSNTSAAFSLARNYPGRPEDGPEILSTSVPTRPRDISDSSERQNQAKSSTDNVSPHRGSQDAHELMTPHEANGNHPENVRIIHFDFSKYRVSTPGSESHPIKIEDSPNAYPSLSIHTRGLSSLQDPISGPAMPAMQHEYQSDDVSRIQNENTDGNPLAVIPANPVSSAAVSSITTSPKAATIFLHCFLASERYWLRSRDHDMDPDIKFWKKIVEHFNAKPHGYRIDAWLTARHIATTLCSQPYKTQVEQQLPGAADKLSGLVSVIEDCRLLSQRRRLRQLSRFEKVKTSVSDTAPRKVLQRSVLERIPQTLEDHKKLMDVLATKCSESTQIKESDREKPKSVVPGACHLGKRKKKYHQHHLASIHGSSASNGIIRARAPSGLIQSSSVIRRDPNKRFKYHENNRPRNRDPCQPTRNGRGNTGGDASSRYTVQDKQRLEQRVRDLEHIVNNITQPRYNC